MNKGRSDAISSLDRDYEEALSLNIAFLRREIDVSFRATGGSIYYAVDGSVLSKRYSNSESTKNRSILNLFEGAGQPENGNLEEQISDVLLEFIFHDLCSSRDQDDRFHILLPGHVDEARSRFRELLEQVGKSRGTSAELSLREYFEKADRLSSNEERFAFLQECEDEIHDLIYRFEQPHHRFREYANLLANRLFTIRRAAVSKPFLSIKNAKGVPVLTNIYKENSEDDFEGSAIWWETKLHDKIPDHFLEKDKYALSALDAINRSVRCKDVRVILITDNDEIIETADKYFPHKHTDKSKSKYSFADLYVRHPKSWLAEEGFLFPGVRSEGEGDRQRALDWLQIFLVDIEGGKTGDLLECKELANEPALRASRKTKLSAVLEKNPQIHENLYDSWRQHLKILEVAHITTSEQATRNLEDIFGSDVDEDFKFLSGFQEYVDRTIESSWTELFLATAQAGYEFLGVKERIAKAPQRRVPMLLMRQHDLGTEFVELLCGETELIESEEQVLSILHKLEESDRRVDDYVRAICCSLLFAVAERWSDANVVCRRAIEIAEGRKRDLTATDNISGREAYYLSAVLTRLSAKRSSDLVPAVKLVREATQAILYERENNLLPVGEAPLSGLRVDAERVAIGLATVFFRLHEAGWDKAIGANQLKDLSSVFENTRNVLSSSGACQQEKIRETTRGNLRTNIFSCLFLGEYLGVAIDFEQNAIKKIVSDQVIYFETLRGSNGNLKLSDLDVHCIMYGVSRCDFEDPIVSELIERYASYLSSPEVSGPMPYDDRRFREMRQIIDAKLFSRNLD